MFAAFGHGNRLIDISVYDQGSNDMQLQYNDQVTILFVFEEAFDDSNLGACNPGLVLNAVSPSSSSSVLWIPRANIINSYGFQQLSPQNQYELQPPTNATLAFQYVVQKGDWTPALDIGNSQVSKGDALSLVCPSTASVPSPFDLSLLPTLSIRPVYYVTSRVAYPVQVKTRQKSGTFKPGDQIDIVIEYETRKYFFSPCILISLLF